MHGQEKVSAPPSVVEELPSRSDVSRDASEPPIIYGNQMPFGAAIDGAREDRADPGTLTLPLERVRQTALRPQLEARDGEPASGNQGAQGEPADRDSSEYIPPATTNGVDPGTSQPRAGVSPFLFPSRVPVADLGIAAHGPCNVCGLESCTICCQPKCITKTIMVPQFRTVWSSLFETRYRTEIKEEGYTIEREVDHQIPRVVTETVMVAEPRIRTFQDFREEEYQEPVDEPYTVMVRKPRQRMVPVEREETYRYPVEQEYTVMVPEEKIVTETKYRTVIDKEPRQEKYTVEVEREKKRLVIDYREKELPIKRRVPVKVKRKIPRTRYEWYYVNEPRTKIVDEPYVEYVETLDRYREAVATKEPARRVVEEGDVIYRDKNVPWEQKVVRQVEETKTIPTQYTVAVPAVVKAYENYTEAVPVTENVTVNLTTRRQVPREVVRKYEVRIPFIENIPRQYKVKVPMQVMKKGVRTIPKQIPRTKYQLVKKDIGKWATTVDTIPTYEIESDRCGCSTCCPKNRTVRRTVWQPNVVVSKVPYTVFETVKKKIPYEYPVLEYRTETRDRMEPVTRYRTETREARFTVFDVKPANETKVFKVQRYKQVPRRREVLVQTFSEEKRDGEAEISEYSNVVSTFPKSQKFREPVVQENSITETFERLGPDAQGQLITTKLLEPVIKTRKKEVSFTVKVPKKRIIEYEEEIELTEYETVTKTIKVQDPIPREEYYTEKVPEIRTRVKYVDVEKRVPYVETKTVTEMVPQKRTRTIYKTDIRTVVELKPEIYFEDVKETFTRTVYKKRIRNVPVNRAEIYWVKVPKVLKKTIFKTVRRKVKQPALRRVLVKVPYQVEVRIPRRVCTMVPQTITIPVEECCEHCTWHLPGVATATNAWLEYGWENAKELPVFPFANLNIDSIMRSRNESVTQAGQ